MTATQTSTAVRSFGELTRADVPFAGGNGANPSVNMDVVDRTRRLVAAAEQRVILEAARKEA